MTIAHADLPNTGLHEPKGILTTGTGDAGKVITPSSTVAGTSEIRSLVEDEITEKKVVLNVEIDDISTAASYWIVSPFAGDIVAVYSVIDGAIATSDALISFEVGGTPVVGGTITVAFTGSAAGDVDSNTPTADNTVTAGQAIEVITDGASTNTVSAMISIVIERT